MNAVYRIVYKKTMDLQTMLLQQMKQCLKIIALTTLLASCATTHSPVGNLNEAPPENIQQIHAWEITGAIAARNQRQGWTASLNWAQQGPENYQIRLFVPLGSGTALISRKNGLTTYQDGKQQSSAQNAEQLLQQKTGISLPVNNLYYWIRGIPAPGAVTLEKRDNLNHLQLLEQSGYKIEYIQSKQANGMILPKQLKLSGADVQIKIVIKQWRI